MEIPEPQQGLVVSFEYQWLYQNANGLVNGTKDRPVVVVLVLDGKESYVAPITSKQPDDLTTAISIPSKVLQHLGLDNKPTWIICDEVNQFIWPGYDLRPIDHNPDTCVYGFLPPKLYESVITMIKYFSQGGKLMVVNRDD